MVCLIDGVWSKSGKACPTGMAGPSYIFGLCGIAAKGGMVDLSGMVN